MADSVTVTTTRSWGQRLKSALAGLILGPIFIAGSLWGLSYNESRSADVITSVAEARKVVVESPSTVITPGYDGKFVHMIGPITGGPLVDALFSVAVTGAVLYRNVEMYQWKESSTSSTHENMGGSETTTTTYSYKKVWSTDMIDSSSFHEKVGHVNPSSWRYASETKKAPLVKVGAYELQSTLLDHLPVEAPVSLDAKKLLLTSGAILQGNEIYIGNNPASPEIGDMRIGFTHIPDETLISLLSEQKGNTIIPPVNQKFAHTTRLEIGERTAEAMFESILTENDWMTWVFRGLGLLVLFIGWSMFFSLLPILGKFIPLLGTIIGFGTGLIAFILTLVLGGGTIIIAWFVVRPVYSIIGIGVIAVLVLGAWKIFKKEPTSLSASASTDTNLSSGI